MQRRALDRFPRLWWGVLRLRPLSVALLTLALSAAVAPSPAGAVDAEGSLGAAGPDCSDPLPLVLDAGLAPTGRFAVDEVEKTAHDLFHSLYEEHSPCAGRRPLRVNIAVGSDYQVLQWLRDGSVDVAIVSDLALHLLSADGVELLELDIPDEEIARLVLPRWRPRIEVRALDAAGEVGQEVSEADALAAFESFRQWLWSGLPAGWTESGQVAPTDLAGCEQVWQLDGPGSGLTLPSHLSGTGFAAPVADTAVWLDGRLEAVATPELRAAAEACFWHAWFQHTCLLLQGDRVRRPDADAAPLGDPCADRWRGGTEIRFRREVDDRAEEVAGLDRPRRDRLVIRRPIAEKLLGAGAFDPADAALEPALEELFERAVSAGRGAGSGSLDGAEPFHAMAASEPYFGTRTFAFTADESLRLLAENQRLSGGRSLALVLPGGGVKAAYQSRLVDSLYGEGLLANVGVVTGGGDGPDAAAQAPAPLAVRHVIGTSGGALLGYFVARLGPAGPYELSTVLWDREPGVPLDAGDVFGSGDLLRYLSVVVVFVLLCLALVLASAGASSPLTPRERPADYGVWRLRLAAIILPLLVLTPVLVRWVTGSFYEHVPEVEGMLFMALVVLAMAVDQCVVFESGTAAHKPGSVPGAAVGLTLLGSLVILAPVAARALGGEPVAEEGAVGPWISEPLGFGAAFLLLGALALGAAMILPVRGPLGLRRAEGRRRTLWAALDVVWVFVLVPFVVMLVWPLTVAVVALPTYLAGLLLLFLVGVVWTVLVSAYGFTLRGAWRWLVYYLVLTAASLVLLGLCLPAELSWGTSLVGAFSLPSRLAVPAGAFLICLGSVLALAGGVPWLVAVRERYVVRGRRAFLAALLVVLGHVVAVYASLLVLGAVLPNGPSALELTGGFWKWLLGLGCLFAVVLVGLGLASVRGRPIAPPIRRCLRHLCGHHPNGALLSRRFLRMLAFSGVGFLWWNLVLAPAFYGNRNAEEYLQRAIGAFDERYGEVHDGADPYRLSAHFVAPANLLEERDGTRYFLVASEEQGCPPLARRSGPGATWYRYHLDTGLAVPRDPACRSLDLRTVQDQDFLERVIFASGSPFPIFPAHVIELPLPDGRSTPLVDGGYSNDTPVEAALTLAADQVLIVQSSHPLGHPSTPSWIGGLLRPLARLRGPLVEDLARLPGYLFERSQQLDRLSRGELFVVTLAPRQTERDWPSLGEFQARTVERMRSTAADDLARHHRIGLVESWGRPRFQVSVSIPGKAPATGI